MSAVVETRRGLTPAQVEASRRDHGSNVLTPPERDPWWKLYLSKFDDPVIRILIIAAAIAIVVGAAEGHVAPEGVGIVIAIFLATYLAFWNEHRASKEFDVLNRTNDDVPVKAYRDGRVTTTFALPNTTEEGPRRRFLVRPDDYREAERQARQAGGDLFGFYHSHPDHPARPSQYDLDHAWPFFSYIIVSVRAGAPEDMTSWRLREDRSAFDQEDLTDA